MTHERIIRDPEVMLGRPVIKGTRIPVDLVLKELAAGLSVADLLRAYPRLTEADIRAALSFAADHVAHEGLIAAE
jgi:uncharacterized protein (DUF433 family)